MRDLIVFDMDGVRLVVDVNESYRAAIQADREAFHRPRAVAPWRFRTGKTAVAGTTTGCSSHRMIQDRGVEASYETVVERFQKIFHGDGSNGLILREVTVAREGHFDRISSTHQLAVFTGRNTMGGARHAGSLRPAVAVRSGGGL